jgi:HEAT repeat protein
MGLKNILGLEKPDIKKMERNKDVNGLMKALSFENDESIRRDAAFALGKISDSSTVDPIINELNYEKNNVINSSVNDVGESTIEQLINSLNNENIDVRKNAASALIKIGEPAVDMLINALENENWRVRWHTAEILGEIKDDRAVKPLINALKDENNGVISNSIIALCEIGEPAVKILINALKSSEWQVRWHTAEILGEIKDDRAVKPLTDALNDENSDVQRAATKALERIRGD